MTHTPSPTPPPATVLPAPPADFTGRTQELADLRNAVETGSTILGLRGLGGVGKTALALKLAEALRVRYPDGQFFLDLQGITDNPLTPSEILARIIRADHPTAKLPETEAELRGLYLSELHGQRALIVLDNARDSAQVTPLLPPPGCLLLITSRQHFQLPGMHALDLDALPLAEASALLKKIAPHIGPQANELAELCGRLPLALTLAGSAVAQHNAVTTADYVRRLQDTRARLELIEASFALSYDLLSPELQSLWRLLAVFPAAFDRAAAQAVWATEKLWAVEDYPAQTALSDLVRYSLVHYSPTSPPLAGGPGGAPPGRYHLHDLARLFAAAQLGAEERAEGQALHALHYLQVLEDANQLFLKGHANLTAGLALFDLEQINIRAGQAWASQHLAQNPHAAHACNTYAGQGSLLSLRLHPRERLRWLEAGLMAARQLNNRQHEGIHLGNLGLAYTALGETHRAIEVYEQRLAIARELGDRRGEGAALGNMGNAYTHLGETRRAVECYEQHLAIAREIGDRQGEGNALGNLGSAYDDLKDTRRAIEFYEQSLALAREIGNRQGEGADLGNLGAAYHTLGDTRRAIEFFDQAIAIKREIGDQRGEANTLFNMALALDALADRTQARGYAKAALEIYETLESPFAERVRKLLADWGA